MVEKVERKKQLRVKRRAAGVCVECGGTSYPYSRCEAHREKHAYSNRKLKEKYKKSGRCPSCGRVLEKDDDGDNVTCNICIEDGVLRKRLNGGPIL